MKIGIVGLPGSGRTTIFNALSGLQVATGPGGKARESAGAIKVPDSRIDTLAHMYRSKKKVFAEVIFVDVGTGGGKTTGLPTQALQAIAQCEALVLVLRGFENPALGRPPDPVRELADLKAELILADLGPLENRRTRLVKDPGAPREKELIEKCIAHLEGERMLADLPLDAAEQRLLSGFPFLSAKPSLWLLNRPEAELAADLPAELAALARAEGREVLAIGGQTEMEIAALPPEEQGEFREALGIATSARDRFVQSAYALLELVTFLTTGEDESRAWPIHRGTTALRAAGKVHSDIERGFIRAEVIAFDELVALGGEKQAREVGKLRLEGKEYLVRDGDVVNFRFNV